MQINTNKAEESNYERKGTREKGRKGKEGGCKCEQQIEQNKLERKGNKYINKLWQKSICQ